MTDRELLERAAKAASLQIFVTPDGIMRDGTGQHPISNAFSAPPWNPLTDDGDALRLAVALRMRVEPWGAGASAVVSIDNRSLVAEPHYGDDPERATRRAIVRAAAALAEPPKC